MNRFTRATVIVILLAMLGGLSKPPVSAEETAPPRAVPRPVKLPGMVIDLQAKLIDLEGVICLDEGPLELVACTKGTKQHESIVALDSRPMHLHTALLLIGAESGNPVMRKVVNEAKGEWIDVAPRGDVIAVSLLVAGDDGKTQERPISDFVRPSAKIFGERLGEKVNPSKFPHTFLFAGSLLLDNESGPRKYMADESGDVISIVSFGDEVLCLSEVHSQDNGALQWEIDATHLPKVGEKVTLRLRKHQSVNANAANK